MLTKAIIKWRINALYSTINRMNNASSKINTLAASIDTLNKTIDNNIKVDDKVPYKDYATTALNNAKGVQGQLSGRIVPSLYYRINELKKELDG